MFCCQTFYNSLNLNWSQSLSFTFLVFCSLVPTTYPFHKNRHNANIYGAFFAYNTGYIFIESWDADNSFKSLIDFLLFKWTMLSIFFWSSGVISPSLFYSITIFLIPSAIGDIDLGVGFSLVYTLWSKPLLASWGWDPPLPTNVGTFTTPGPLYCPLHSFYLNIKSPICYRSSYSYFSNGTLGGFSKVIW